MQFTYVIDGESITLDDDIIPTKQLTVVTELDSIVTAREESKEVTVALVAAASALAACVTAMDAVPSDEYDLPESALSAWDGLSDLRDAFTAIADKSKSLIMGGDDLAKRAEKYVRDADEYDLDPDFVRVCDDLATRFRKSFPAVKVTSIGTRTTKGKLDTVPDGTRVTFRGSEGVITGGALTVGGMTFTSPSAAAKAVSGGTSELNGWREWKLTDGRELGALRG